MFDFSHARRRRIPVLAAALVMLLSGAAQASTSQPNVVSEHAQDATPEVVASSAVPQPHVNAFAQIGSTMYAGGEFDTVSQGGTSYARANILAFNKTTGAVSSTWVPSVDGQVWSIVADPSTNSIYVGGAFANVNGTARAAVVKLNATTGAMDTSFAPTFTGGIVNDMQLVTINGVKHLFIGGSPAKKLMSLNPATGKDDKYFTDTIANALPGAWGGVAIYQFSIDPSQTHLIATGNFQTVDGQSRSKFLMLDLGSTGATLDSYYYPGFSKPCSSTAARRIAYLQGVDWSPDGKYFDITATGQIPKNKSDIWYQRLGSSNVANTTVCDAVGRFALTDSTKPVWINYTGGDSIWRAADTGAAVYIAGHFRWTDNPDGYNSVGVGDKTSGAPAANRPGIAAINPSTGLSESWNPRLSNTKEGGKGFLVTSDGLWIGNDATAYNGVSHVGMEFAPLPVSTPDQVVWAVGDACSNAGSPPACAQVGKMIAADTSTTAVLGLGDLQYPAGAASDWSTFYDPAMGSGVGLKSLTDPVPGDVDYASGNADDYFSYWGSQAGSSSQGWYSKDLGGWRVIATNSDCTKVGGCGATSAQGEFLANAIADTGSDCELVFDNSPAYSDGPNGDQQFGKSLFTIAANKGADLFVSAHDNDYQRFPALNASGSAVANGLTQFVVGTGGQGLTGWSSSASRSSYRENTDLGAVRFVLSDGSWSATFHSVSGQVLDTSSGTCH